MNNAYYTVPTPYNEPVRSYMVGSPERESLKKELDRQAAETVTIPLIIGGKEVYTDTFGEIRMPHDHKHILARYCIAGEKELKQAVDAALAAKDAWADTPFEHRASIFLKIAELLSGPYRDKINAATMLGQSKTVYQAEIDSACELADFFRFNPYYAQQVYSNQPLNAKGVWNRVEYRPLDGFVLAITPFNFTSIDGNLPGTPALMGNTVVWKPSSTAILSNYYFMRLMMDAGLPAGVINFVPSRGSDVSKYVVPHRLLAGFHFTGSTEVFSSVFESIGKNIRSYLSFPRLVGETGGKDFVFAHSTADVDALVAALVRGSFEYQGQKCSAASRAFIPASLWGKVEPKLLAAIKTLKIGDVRDFTSFLSAVIDETSFDNLVSYIELAKASPDAEVLCGGYDKSVGYFVQPTVIRALKPDFETMKTELFGPVLTVYIYDDAEFERTLEICDTATTYALTGAIFAGDRSVIMHMEKALRNAAGNFYINDKPTGAVVGQQPFGGARGSGTNDKSGSLLNLFRWVSPRAIKETLAPSDAIIYPYMSEK